MGLLLELQGLGFFFGKMTGNSGFIHFWGLFLDIFYMNFWLGNITGIIWQGRFGFSAKKQKAYTGYFVEKSKRIKTG